MVLPKFTIEYDPEIRPLSTDGSRNCYGALTVIIQKVGKPRFSVSFRQPDPRFKQFQFAMDTLMQWVEDWEQEQKKP